MQTGAIFLLCLPATATFKNPFIFIVTDVTIRGQGLSSQLGIGYKVSQMIPKHIWAKQLFYGRHVSFFYALITDLFRNCINQKKLFRVGLFESFDCGSGWPTDCIICSD